MTLLSPVIFGSQASQYGYYHSGTVYNNNSASSYGNSLTTGDVVGIAFDADGGNLYFYKNGVVQNSGTAAFTGLTSGPYFFGGGENGATGNWNFGQRSFAHTPPSGYVSLCTTNLPNPTIADGSTAFDVALWTGNGSTQTISGLNLSPDFIWHKIRSISGGSQLYDTVRGTSKRLRSDNTDAESTLNGVTSFNSDGWTMSAGNNNNESYVSWVWDAGSSTVSNTDGSITSQVRANPTAGFSIVKYTGNGTQGASVGHGLNVVPEFVIGKRLSSNKYWAIYHKDVHPKVLYFDTSAAAQSQEQYNEARPTSSVVELGSTGGTTNTSGDDSILYCFAPVNQFSSVGSWTGNGSTDGPFVYTGHKVAWLMYKRTDSSNSWQILDTTRDPTNVNNLVLLANSSNGESTGTGNNDQFDLLSNGFKVRSSNHAGNASGGTYIYLAFAEHPFKTARAR